MNVVKTLTGDAAVTSENLMFGGTTIALSSSHSRLAQALAGVLVAVNANGSEAVAVTRQTAANRQIERLRSVERHRLQRRTLQTPKTVETSITVYSADAGFAVTLFAGQTEAAVVGRA